MPNQVVLPLSLPILNGHWTLSILQLFVWLPIIGLTANRLLVATGLVSLTINLKQKCAHRGRVGVCLYLGDSGSIVPPPGITRKRKTFEKSYIIMQKCIFSYKIIYEVFNENHFLKTDCSNIRPSMHTYK